MHDAILHWRVYLQNAVPFDTITDHYALVYMVTKVGGDPHHRLARLCLDLQGYTFSVTHRAGKHHLLPDAVSRLLQSDDVAYVNTVEDLRDDFSPLSQEEVKRIMSKYTKDGGYVIDTINNYRVSRDRDEAIKDKMRKDKLRDTRVYAAEPSTGGSVR